MSAMILVASGASPCAFGQLLPPKPVPANTGLGNAVPNLDQLKQNLLSAQEEYHALLKSVRGDLHNSQVYKDAVSAAAAAQEAFENTPPFTMDRIHALDARDTASGKVAELDEGAFNSAAAQAASKKVDDAQKVYDNAVAANVSAPRDDDAKKQKAAPRSDLVGSTYDKFKDETRVILEVIDRGDMPAAFHLLFTHSGTDQKAPPDDVRVIITMTLTYDQLLDKSETPSLMLLCDDNRYEVKLYHMITERTTSRTFQQTFGTLWKLAELEKFAAAKRIDMKFPNGLEHSWTAEELQGLQDLTSRAQGRN